MFVAHAKSDESPMYSCEGPHSDYWRRTVDSIPGIDEEMPNFDVRNRFHLRPYQWRKHGRCVAKLRGRIENCRHYFLAIMHAARWINAQLDRWLNFDLFPEGFPTDEQQHQFPYQRITEDIRSLIGGYEVIVKWYTTKIQGRTERWIDSINFCFDLSLRPINCNTNLQRMLLTE